jgi:hypothetical protein
VGEVNDSRPVLQQTERVLQQAAVWQQSRVFRGKCANAMPKRQSHLGNTGLTGAERYRICKFEQSQGSTILLDGIGNMPLALQAREYNSGARSLGSQTLSPLGLTPF